MHDVKKLSLVLMQTLNLNVEDRAGIYVHAVVLLDVLRKAELVLIFDLHELALSILIVRILRDTSDLRKIGDPAVANLVGYPLRK